MKSKALVFTLGMVLTIPLIAQVRPLITEPINETKLTKLLGNLHPLARADYDRGKVADSFSAGHMLLLLNRPAERESALQEFLIDVHRRDSARFHQWLTPQQFGQQFGPADSDVQEATNWLKSQGFTVVKTAKSKQFVEFSGTAGQLRKAFHTEIHRYNIQGETHYANASEISVPQALAPLIRSVSSLNDFHAKPQLHTLGPANYSRASKKTTPQFTITNPSGNFYALAPEDFATQYDLTPLYQAGVDGTGQTIGIINETNIDIGLVDNYRQLFNLPSNAPQVVIDGNDPGTVARAEVEAYLDVEVAGSVAPKATVNLYIASNNALQDPVSLAAIRAVEDNQASVLSVSFGLCEGFLASGNQFWSSLWEQAAAQGQTVLVASGDSGSATCDPAGFLHTNFGLAVSGIASTPWNVAVGGTDFYYSDYASGAPSTANLWNQTNDPSLGSLKAPLQEQVWNDFLGLNAAPFPPGVVSDVGAGGGASNCVIQSGGTCSAGNPKPSWQTGPGVPADGVRDLPDVSLFAANGNNLSSYPICAFPGECTTSSSQTEIFLVGGTSASTPAMAGIMALINQKYGRQGQANFTLYPLAQQKPTAFHDVTIGSNNVPCVQNSADCSLDTNGDGLYTLQKYPAAAGYDLASGLGSVDAAVLVNNWNSISLKPTTTTLSLSSSSITHGQPVTLSTSVAPSSGAGTPTGDVAILTDSPLPANQAQTLLTLSGGHGSQSVTYFPGGSYQVSAQYHGDGIFGSSASFPVAISVKPENSNINFLITNNQNTISNGGTLEYNNPLALNIQPTGISAPAGHTNGNATGTATFTIDSTTATVPLNGVGIASWNPPALSIGNHTVKATYSGDDSFNPSSATPITFSITQGQPFLSDNVSIPLGNVPGARGIIAGGTLTVGVEVGPFFGAFFSGTEAPFGTVAPTGTVTVCLGPFIFNATCLNPNYFQTVPLVSPVGNNFQYSSAVATFPNLAVGNYIISFTYSGDDIWQRWGLIDTAFVTVIPPSSTTAATTTTLSISPNAISGTDTATFTATVAGPSGATVAPTGWVTLYDNNSSAPYLEYFPLTPGTGATSTFTASFFSPAYFWSEGDNQIVAVYSGDTNYLPSTSSASHLAVTQRGSDFALMPQIPQITVKPGGSGTIDLNLISLAGFNGAVALTCAPSSSKISCTVTPDTPTLNGTATAKLTINASTTASELQVPSQHRRLGWTSTGGILFASIFLAGFADRKRRLSMLLNFILFGSLLVIVNCGGGQDVKNPPPPPPPPAPGVTYNVLVNATGGGIVHNAKLTVVVR